MELPGIEPAALTGLLPLSCSFVTSQSDSVRLANCGFVLGS